MFLKRVLQYFLFAMILFSCTDGDNTSFGLNDPDPVDPEEIPNLPVPSSNLFAVVNINGNIWSIDNAQSPATVELLLTDVSTEDYASSIFLSDDRKYLLYTDISTGVSSLTLFNLETKESTLIERGTHSNESQFVFSDSFQYSYEGRIIFYDIPSGLKTPLLENDDRSCNHGGTVSPASDKLIFKNQDPSVTDYAMISWSEIMPGTTSTAYEDIYSYNNTIQLYQSFSFTWLDNENVVFKDSPNPTNRIQFQKLVSLFDDKTITWFDLERNGIDLLYREMKVSPDGNSLLLYGYFGAFLIDLRNMINPKSGDFDITGAIEPEELFFSTYDKTKFASFTPDSSNIIIGTDKWIGIYDTATKERTSFDYTSLLNIGDVLYALDCK